MPADIIMGGARFGPANPLTAGGTVSVGGTVPVAPGHAPVLIGGSAVLSVSGGTTQKLSGDVDTTPYSALLAIVDLQTSGGTAGGLQLRWQMKSGSGTLYAAVNSAPTALNTAAVATAYAIGRDLANANVAAGQICGFPLAPTMRVRMDVVDTTAYSYAVYLYGLP